MTEPFSRLIEDKVLIALYEEQLGPHSHPFKLFLDALKERLGLVLAGINIGIGENDIEPVPLRYHPDSDSHGLELFHAHQRLWRLYPIKAGVKAGDIYTLDQIQTTAELASNAYFQALLAPFGVANELVAAVSGPDGALCLLRLGACRERPIHQAHVAFIEQLRPHLERALQLHMWTRRPTSIVNMLTTMANRLDIGFFILNGHKLVIQNNAVAARMLTDGDSLAVDGHKIVFLKSIAYNKLMNDLLDRALVWRYQDFQRTLAADPGADQSGNESSDNVPSAVFRVDRDDGSHLDFLIQPVRTFVPYRNETSPHLIVYIVDSHRRIAAPEALVMQLYGLTRTQARLALLLANGVSIADAAQSLGLTEGSARTYSKRLYEKIGVKRQAELVEAIHMGVIPLAT